VKVAATKTMVSQLAPHRMATLRFINLPQHYPWIRETGNHIFSFLFMAVRSRLQHVEYAKEVINNEKDFGVACVLLLPQFQNIDSSNCELMTVPELPESVT
jgi:hypothetical protein